MKVDVNIEVDENGEDVYIIALACNKREARDVANAFRRETKKVGGKAIYLRQQGKYAKAEGPASRSAELFCARAVIREHLIKDGNKE